MSDKEKNEPVTPVVNVASLEYLRDPYSQLKPFQEMAAVCFIESLPLPAHVILRHAEAKAALGDSCLTRDPGDWEFFDPNMYAGCPTLEWQYNNSPMSNEALHRYHREIFQDAIKPSTIRKMDEKISRVMVENLHHFSNDHVDVVAAMDSVGLIVLAEILGLKSETGSDEFIAKCKAYLRGSTAIMLDLKEKEAAEEGTLWMANYTRSMIKRGRLDGNETLMDEFISAIEKNEEITEDHVVLSIMAMLIAGAHTTTQSIALMVREFANNPDQLNILRNNPELADNAVEEALRITQPSKFLIRFAKDDISIGGHLLPKGKMVLIPIAAANKDPQVFPDPEKMDIRRENLSLALSFGRGLHYCTGVHVAKSILRLTIKGILEKTSGPLEIVSEEWDQNPIDIMWRGLKTLTVKLNH